MEQGTKILTECGKTKSESFRIKYSKIEACRQRFLKHHEIRIYEKYDYLLNCNTKIKDSLQLNLIIYSNIDPMSNIGLQKFLEAFIIKI